MSSFVYVTEQELLAWSCGEKEEDDKKLQRTTAKQSSQKAVLQEKAHKRLFYRRRPSLESMQHEAEPEKEPTNPN